MFFGVKKKTYFNNIAFSIINNNGDVSIYSDFEEKTTFYLFWIPIYSFIEITERDRNTYANIKENLININGNKVGF